MTWYPERMQFLRQVRRGGRGRALGVMAVLAILNIAAWLVTWKASTACAFLLASGWLAYSFGLRHAVDADHICAIDNVTRKLAADGRRSVGVGLFFSLGHSTVVVVLCAAFAWSSNLVQARIEHWKALGALLGTLISGGFLYAIGAINLLILIDLYRRSRSGDANGEGATALPGGLLGRLLSPVLAMVRRSWQMYFVGFLFGLGFDTATEVGILAISARSANHGLAFGAVMLLPLLFTVGMCLVDTLDGILMAGAYGWSAGSPMRRLRYNAGITAASILVAFAVGTVELIGLAPGGHAVSGLSGATWLGPVIITAFAAVWLGAAISARRSPA